MNKTYLAVTLLSLLMMGGCGEIARKHFISDQDVREQISEDFDLKRATLSGGDLFAVFNNGTLSPAEREALTFLYAYMPIGDVTDYDGDFYLRNVRSSFSAKREMPWGDYIPETIFRHFVLPVRVNNENLDESRMLFYEELKNRVKGLSMQQAVLEVNHWCHEKVIYTPSDARTSSPLASLRTAYGRCGEESVFTVAALRSVGIPARQVYTPRWAHTDDNHAWVEAWVDGRWRFMGACEPEPVLDMAWFNAPAYRGMLMHTKVFGRYSGPEETMEQTGCYTEINVIDNYAPSGPVTIVVTGLDGRPVPGATVEFKIYNYAEFYTVSRETTDSEGQASLSAGLGDMLVWASHDGRFGLARVSFGKDKTVGITLDKTPGDAVDLPLDIIPPPDGSIPVSVTEEQKKENAIRLSEEDSIRNRYTSSFYTAEKSSALAATLKLDAARLGRIMTASRGNWHELEHFLEHAADKAVALALLEAVSAKDLRDTPSSVLEDHLGNTVAGDSSDPVFVNYLLNPRVANELLSPYRSRFAAGIPQDLRDALAADPQALSQWVSDNITIDDDLNPQRIPILPSGVWRARVADEHSRNIFYVALARSLGYPSRIEAIGGKVQRLSADRSRWIDVDFERPDAQPVAEGSITAPYYPTRELPDPKYYSHFTIAKIRPDGTLRTLNFESEAQVDMGLGDTWSALLKRPLGMDEGHYILVTGTRMARGNVLANITSFNVDPGRNTRLELRMRQDASDIQVLGSIDAEATFRLASDGSESSILNTTGRGYFAIGILAPGEEPSNHALRSLVSSAPALEEWGRRIILLFPGREEWERFNPQEFEGLPESVVYGIDHEGRISAMLASALNLSTPPRLPVFIIADTFGRVVFISEGYTIGLADSMLQTIPRL